MNRDDLRSLALDAEPGGIGGRARRAATSILDLVWGLAIVAAGIFALAIVVGFVDHTLTRP